MFPVAPIPVTLGLLHMTLVSGLALLWHLLGLMSGQWG